MIKLLLLLFFFVPHAYADEFVESGDFSGVTTPINNILPSDSNNNTTIFRFDGTGEYEPALIVSNTGNGKIDVRGDTNMKSLYINGKKVLDKDGNLYHNDKIVIDSKGKLNSSALNFERIETRCNSNLRCIAKCPEKMRAISGGCETRVSGGITVSNYSGRNNWICLTPQKVSTIIATVMCI